MGIVSSELPKDNLIRVDCVTSSPLLLFDSNRVELSSMSATQIAVRLAVGGPGTGALELPESHTAAAFIIVAQNSSKALFSVGNRSAFVQLQAGMLMSLDPSLWRGTAVTWA